MTSYISKKEHVFRHAGDGQDLVERKKSQGRLKTISSTSDARAWTIPDEQRRQYILDLIRAPPKKESSLGKYIPVEVLIDLLLANKNADIARLQKELDELKRLLEIYESLELTDAQKAQFNKMKAQMDDTMNVLFTVAKTETSSTYLSGLDNDDETESGCTPDTCIKLKGTRSSGCTTSTCKKRLGVSEYAPNAGTGDTDYSQLDVATLRKYLEERDKELSEHKAIAVEAIEQLESLKKIMEERDKLKKKLTHSKIRIQSLEQDKSQLAKAIVCNKPCEFIKLEAELSRLRNNNQLTPAQEADIIKRELEVLKKYCENLSHIQEENDYLKREINYLKTMLETDNTSALTDAENEVELQCKALECKLRKSTDKVKTLEKKLDSARKDVMSSDEVQILRQRSDILDDVLDERNDLRRRLDRLAGMDDKVKSLKHKAELLEMEKDQLQAEIDELKKNKRLSDYQLNDMHSLKQEKDMINRSLKCACAERDELRSKVANLSSMQQSVSDFHKQSSDLQSVMAERNMLRMKMAEMEGLRDEIEKLRMKASEADMLKLERCKMSMRIEEMATAEIEMYRLMDENKRMRRETDTLRDEVCRMKNIIANLENEMSNLVTNIDDITRGSEDQQVQLKSCQSQTNVQHNSSPRCMCGADPYSDMKYYDYP